MAKKCKHCKTEFAPKYNSLQKFCGQTKECRNAAYEYAKPKAEKKIKTKWRKEKQVLKEQLKTYSDHVKETQSIFNKFIRLRDHNDPCISCNNFVQKKKSRGGEWDCGHYRSVGAMPQLRFEELNAHKQCVKCNRFLGGNVVEYRINLVKKIGQENLDWVEGPHPPAKWTVDELKTKQKYYKEKIKELEKEIEQH